MASSRIIGLFIALIAAIDVLTSIAYAGSVPRRGARELPLCGSIYSPPFGDKADAGPRPCGTSRQRNYTPTNKGLGFDILNLESEACFVEDASYRLLDDIVTAVKQRVSQVAAAGNANTPAPFSPLVVSGVTGDVLAERGFGLYIPTRTLGDALYARNKEGERERHVFDCDTGAMILLTVADTLALSGALVEITLPSGSGHNYVRWTTSEGKTIDWDTNGRAQCETPPDLPSFEGRAMSRDEVTSYVLRMRGTLWEKQGDFIRAENDYRRSAALAPDHPGGHNGFAWLIATTEVPDRQARKAEAMSEAEKAVGLQRSANNLDTLACVFALTGNFQRAAEIQQEVVRLSPKPEFTERLRRFTSPTPRDCTGME